MSILLVRPRLIAIVAAIADLHLPHLYGQSFLHSVEGDGDRLQPQSRGFTVRSAERSVMRKMKTPLGWLVNTFEVSTWYPFVAGNLDELDEVINDDWEAQSLALLTPGNWAAASSTILTVEGGDTERQAPSSDDLLANDDGRPIGIWQTTRYVVTHRRS